jgi:hypothetical protein
MLGGRSSRLYVVGLDLVELLSWRRNGSNGMQETAAGREDRLKHPDTESPETNERYNPGVFFGLLGKEDVSAASAFAEVAVNRSMFSLDHRKTFKGKFSHNAGTLSRHSEFLQELMEATASESPEEKRSSSRLAC